MTGIIVLCGIALGTIILLWKACEYNCTKAEEVKNDTSKIKIRIIIGSITGMTASWALYWTYLYLNDLTPSKMNPYVSTLYIIGMIPSGIIGITIGTMVSLITQSRKY